MIDKSIPFAKLYMRRAAGTPIPAIPLPDGFRYTFFSDGAEHDWARIETSAGEFDDVADGVAHFTKEFLPHVDELRRRCFFIENSDGRKVATANAWWVCLEELAAKNEWQALIEPERRPLLHWVAVEADYQGRGLGKAIISRVTELLREVEGDTDFYLSTQTWSHKAINIYKATGYEPHDEDILYGERFRGHYGEALRILGDIQ